MKHKDLSDLLSAALPVPEATDNGDGTFTHTFEIPQGPAPTYCTVCLPRNWLCRIILEILGKLGIDAWDSFLASRTEGLTTISILWSVPANNQKITIPITWIEIE